MDDTVLIGTYIKNLVTEGLNSPQKCHWNTFCPIFCYSMSSIRSPRKKIIDRESKVNLQMRNLWPKMARKWQKIDKNPQSVSRSNVFFSYSGRVFLYQNE